MELIRPGRLPGPPIDEGDVVLDAPPELPRATPTSPLARVLPVVMLVAALGMAALFLTSGQASRGPLALLLPVMMGVSALGSVAYGMRGTRRVAELQESRATYLRYVDAVDDAVARTAERQRVREHWEHPDPRTLWSVVGGRRTWERRAADPDFCHVRIGLGHRPLSTTLVPTPRPDGDPLTAAAVERLTAERATVAELPVTVDLRAHGRLTSSRDLARALLCQLAVFHHPADVRIRGPLTPEWDWLKWLPHQRDAGARQTAAAHTVVVIDGGPVPDDADDVTVLAIADHDDPWPAVVSLDALSRPAALACARRLAALDPYGAARLATAPRWADLVGVGDPARLDPVLAWRPRLGRSRLRVPIGVTDDGRPVDLDLKEAAHGGMGPHGLCIGATGSGKSELLRTLALGLVATHSPDALNLALIDFKGGATFHGFEGLRHVAAVITNLADEAHLVTRMRDALSGEMTRRQELLRTSGAFAGIADYDRARAAGVALPPLPVLLIVVDEFSELLTQQPDLAELFVAIGRLGRSLGMHLLLASQRLDEGRLRGLESHLSYRIALKTFSAAESRAVLGSTDAHTLPHRPGLAYLKTADGDLTRFRAAYVSDGVEVDDGASARSARPTLFTAAPPADGEAVRRSADTVLATVLSRLAGRGRPAHRVWSPPLDAAPPLGTLLDDAGLPDLVVPIGLLDKPFEQRRDVLIADLRGAGGNVAVVGGPRSGKTTAVLTLLLALAARHAARDVRIYALDFGDGALGATAALPHVGAVAGRSRPALARRIVGYVEQLVRQRQTDGGDDGGHVLLVVDGWAAARRDVDGLEEAVTALAGHGLAVGVHVVLTTARWADLRPALKDQLATRIELRLGDPAESELHRIAARTLADRPAGHGITRAGHEFVVATPQLGDGDEVDRAFAAVAERSVREHGPWRAPRVRLLPTRVDYVDVSGAPAGAVPFGIGDAELLPVALDVSRHPHLLVLGDGGCGRSAVLRTVLRGVGGGRLLVVDPRRTHLGLVDGPDVAYATSAAVARDHVDALAALLRTRLPGPEVSQRQLRDRSWWSGPEAWVVVDDYDLLADAATGNPLSGLTELLPHAVDVGLHVILARRAGGAARAMFDPVLSRLRDLGAAGFAMSARPDEGPLFGSVRPAAQPPGRGTLVRPGHPDQLVQVAWTDPP
ncbi:type VII secretion protein EccCa [Mycolicibacterium grossiae]|uniref:FtsK domain-containing protein n=2 Tax=Mycolicibacterium grossiae TaxID=1552759 RepID=A0A1E8PWV9_9MYCO|nr:type VII secretion protein EccCa [Mycolicibacterium grossiae]OFJ50793.1 hypothetical protein BEL07_26315 [Mycolicibacterium grossiae]QEM48204.1 type VII secretion protein EccCa [Mycolicibacterium grossiae]